jgi:hypothetical protein
MASHVGVAPRTAMTAPGLAVPVLQQNVENVIRPASSDRPPSSPIDDSVEESVIIEAFFRWKASSLPNQRAREKWLGALQVVEHEMWTIDDLKKMSVRFGEMWRVAIDKGIPDGIATTLVLSLQQFKGHYRKTGSIIEEYI